MAEKQQESSEEGVSGWHTLCFCGHLTDTCHLPSLLSVYPPCLLPSPFFLPPPLSSQERELVQSLLPVMQDAVAGTQQGDILTDIAEFLYNSLFERVRIVLYPPHGDPRFQAHPLVLSCALTGFFVFGLSFVRLLGSRRPLRFNAVPALPCFLPMPPTLPLTVSAALG